MATETSSDGTVGKALDVLDLVASFDRPVRFNEVLARSPFPKATLYRFVQTLTKTGMLAYDPDRHTYAPGLRLVRLAHTAWRQASLAPIARPYVEEISAQVGETIHVAQMEGGQVLFVDKVKAVDMFETMARVGKVAPGYCTGVGKAILAFLPCGERDRALKQQAYMRYTPSTHADRESLEAELADIRKQGIAYDREEHERSIISIAAPILTDSGSVIGSLSIATSTSRHSLESLEQFRPQLLATAEKIGTAAAVWQFPH